MPQEHLKVENQQKEQNRAQKEDKIWMLSLYGTAIGAGTLFLPINAGLHGIIPLLFMAIVAFPMTYYSHQALCRFVLSGSSGNNNITEVVEEHFGRISGNILTGLYFFAIYPILLMYSVAITNTTESFIVNQLHCKAPPRALLALGLILMLMSIIRLGSTMIVKAMSYLVYPFIVILILLALYLIPYWNSAMFHPPHTGSEQGLITTLWLLIPVMVFSFNHSPIISSFAVNQKERYGHEADRKASAILKRSHFLMLITVMFFVFSCVLSLSPTDLALAKQQNISILSYLANHFKRPVIAYIAPLIAFIAIAKSFFGHYLGAKEGLEGLITKLKPGLCSKKLYRFIEVFIVFSCFLTASLNPNILTMIEGLGGPVIALILFIMPTYAIYKIPAMKGHKNPLTNLFILLIGLITFSALVYTLLF